MHHSRNSTALPQLIDLSREPDPPRWTWDIARPDPEGRLRLPTEAQVALGVQPGRRRELRGICHSVALTLRAGGSGAPMTVDSRGRLSLPAWLRRTAGALVVGTDRDASVVVVAPVTVLDALGPMLTGAPR